MCVGPGLGDWDPGTTLKCQWPGPGFRHCGTQAGGRSGWDSGLPAKPSQTRSPTQRPIARSSEAASRSLLLLTRTRPREPADRRLVRGACGLSWLWLGPASAGPGVRGPFDYGNIGSQCGIAATQICDRPEARAEFTLSVKWTSPTAFCHLSEDTVSCYQKFLSRIRIISATGLRSFQVGCWQSFAIEWESQTKISQQTQQQSRP